jgi:hypothetical protein
MLSGSHLGAYGRDTLDGALEKDTIRKRDAGVGEACLAICFVRYSLGRETHGLRVVGRALQRIR